MAKDIGIIKTLIGTATATAPNGVQRNLNVGDKVAENEVVSTGVLGAIELEFNDGSIMTLGRNSQAMLSNDVFGFDESEQDSAFQSAPPSDVESIQQAILEGQDPTQTEEATAAGAGVESGNEGADFVQVLYENPQVIPEAGFDTTGISFAFEEEFIDDGTFEDSNSSISDSQNTGNDDDQTNNGLPSAATTILLLDEDDLSAGFIADGFAAIDTAFETATGLTAFPASKNGNNDLSSGDDVAQNSSTVLSGTLNVDFGSDGAGDIIFNASDTLPTGITSNGNDLQYWVSEDGHSLVGFVSTGTDTVEIVFTAEITNPQTGEFTAVLYGSVDHPNTGTSTEENLTIDLGFTVTDIDGDSAQGVLRFDIDDEIPVIGSGQDAPEPSTVDEEGLINGNIDDGYSGDVTGADITANGNLNINWGADDGDARTVTFSSSMAGSTVLTSDGESISYSISQEGALLTASAGSRTVFTVELSKDDQGSYEFTLLDNLDHPTADTEDDIDLIFNFVATDADGDTVSSNFSVKVNDDAPLAENDADTTENGVATGNVLTNDSLGVDGGELTGVEFGSVTGAQNADGSYSVKGDHGTLTVDANGQYSYTYESEVGDVSLLTKTAFNIGESFIGLDGKYSSIDATGVVTSQTNGFGVSGTSGQNTQAPTQINYSGSQSEALAFGFGQQTVTSVTVKISNMFQSENGGEAARWYAFDAAGNQVASGVVSANNSGPYENTTQVTWLNNHQAEFTVTNIGSFSTLVFEAIPYSGDGSSLTDNSDYLVSVTAYDVAPSGGDYSDTFTYTVTDGDGDTAQATLTIDGNAITGDAQQTIAPVAEDNDESVNENTTINGNIIIDDNNDGGAASGRDWDQDTPVANLVISTFDGDALTATKTITTQYGTLTVNPDGSYSYSADQPAANELAFGEAVTETFTYTIVDPNGNTSNQAELNIEIQGQNDTPVVSALNAQTNEDTTITFTASDLLSGATDVDATDTLSIDNVTLASGDGELVDNGNGTWSYTPAPNSDLDAVVNFEVTDGIASVANTMSIDVVAVADQPNLHLSVGEGIAVKTFENLIVNGSFEDISGENRNGQLIGDFNIYSGGLVKMKSITGWLTTEGAPMEPHHKLHAGVGTTDGDNYMDLGASPGNSSISQTMQLIAGAEYTLSVDYLDKAAKQESGISGQNSGVMQVIWNGVVVATIQGNNIDDWETLDNISLIGDSSGSNTLTFSEVGDADDNWGMAIDNIQLFHVPYQYEVSIFTNLTDIDGSEVLGPVDISSLPDGVTYDGTYLVSSTPLTDDQINQITASVTSTETSNADQATTTVTAKLEFGALDASAETADVLIKATAASENIIGGAGDDVIFGGAGNDTISGGAGADQFIWADADVGTVASPAIDVINDFDASEGDTLNLSDLLSDPSENNTITGLENNGHLELQISNGSDVIQKIDITSIAVANDAAAVEQLNTLLANGSINDGI